MCRIEVRDVRRAFADRTVLRGASMSVESGEVAVLTGKNGAGKSTLLRLIAGILAPEGGSILLGGRPPREALRVRKPRTGTYLPENFFYGDLTVEENLRLYSECAAAPKALLDELVERLELGSFLRTRLRDASQGVIQRASLVRCFVPDPELLLLDEPASHLDRSAKAAFLELLSGQRKKGATTVYVTHEEELPGGPVRKFLVSAGEISSA